MTDSSPTYEYLQREKVVQRRINEMAAEVVYGASFEDFCSTVSFMLFDEQSVNQDHVWSLLSQAKKQKFDRWQKERSTNSKHTTSPTVERSRETPLPSRDAHPMSPLQNSPQCGPTFSLQNRVLTCQFDDSALERCCRHFHERTEHAVEVDGDVSIVQPEAAFGRLGLLFTEEEKCTIRNAHLRLVRVVGTEGIFQFQVEFTVKSEETG